MKRSTACSILVTGLLLAGCSSDSDAPTGSDSPTSSTTSSTGASTGSLPVAWTAEPQGEPQSFVLPEEGANPVVAGERAVVFAGSRVTGYEAATGAIAWTAELPATVCAASRTADDSGRVAVLLGDSDRCRDAAVLDTTSGKLVWTSPIPRAGKGFGHEAAIGPDAVVVSAECAGFTIFSLDDGSVRTTVPGDKVDGVCASAASDGTSVVLASQGSLSVYDATSGERTGSWPVDGLGRVGDVVVGSPLVASVNLSSGRQLVDLSGASPRLFGRDAGGFGGEPTASAVIGTTLFVQYEDVADLVGYDLSTGDEVATVPIGTDGRLVGTRDDRLVVTTGEAASDGVQVEEVDPAASAPTDQLGTVGSTSATDGDLAGTALVGSTLVRVWEHRIEAVDLP